MRTLKKTLSLLLAVALVAVPARDALDQVSSTVTSPQRSLAARELVLQFVAPRLRRREVAVGLRDAGLHVRHRSSLSSIHSRPVDRST